MHAGFIKRLASIGTVGAGKRVWDGKNIAELNVFEGMVPENF